MEKEFFLLNDLLDKLLKKYPDNKELGEIINYSSETALSFYIGTVGLRERIEKFQERKGLKQCIN